MKKLLTGLCLLATLAQAAEHEVQMLSWGKGQPMIFDPAVLQIEAGDTVTFIPVQKGHQVDSVVIPEGAEKMYSEIDQRYSVTLHKTGIYLYTCIPHRTMNMSGLIQIGAPTNRVEVVKAIDELEEKAIMNKGRLRKYLAQLDELNKQVRTKPVGSNAAEQSAKELTEKSTESNATEKGGDAEGAVEKAKSTVKKSRVSTAGRVPKPKDEEMCGSPRKPAQAIKPQPAGSSAQSTAQNTQTASPETAPKSTPKTTQSASQ